MRLNLRFSILAALFFQTSFAATAAGPVDEAALRNAWALYSHQQYAASADAFEILIRKSTPNARLYYCAALANKGSNRIPRAKQLCQYVVTNFPTSAEAASARSLLQDAAPALASAASSGLPASLNGKSLDELMQTEEGRQILKEALSKQKNSGAVTSSAASLPAASGSGATGAGATGMGTAGSGMTRAGSTASGAAPHAVAKGSSAQDGSHLFSAATIAADGADAITHFSGYPDCWFESSLVALVRLPRGQELLSQMIRSAGSDGTCIVRFPGDGIDYTITPKKLEESRIRDKALWASLIHCAQLMKFHSRSGEIEEGLSCLTGKKAEKLFSANTTEQALISFVGDAVKMQNPIICLAADDIGTLPELAEAYHAYTIIDFDPASKMITMKDAHGDNSRRFRMTTDPEHKKFEQLNNGIFKMHVSIFPRYFSQVVRSSI